MNVDSLGQILCQEYNPSSGPILYRRGETAGGPHTCPYCNKGWRTKSALEMHIRVHTGGFLHRFTNQEISLVAKPCIR